MQWTVRYLGVTTDVNMKEDTLCCNAYISNHPIRNAKFGTNVNMFPFFYLVQMLKLHTIF